MLVITIIIYGDKLVKMPSLHQNHIQSFLQMVYIIYKLNLFPLKENKEIYKSNDNKI